MNLRVLQLGIVPYEEALLMQKRLGEERRVGAIPDTLLLLEHPPTITLGRNADRRNVTASPDDLARGGITCVETDRGGDVTYHGPGQLVGYPILDLSRSPHSTDLHRYFRNLEETIIRAIGEFGIAGTRIAGLTGVWVGEVPRNSEKIAAMGIRVSRWITRHGFALNVSPELSHFQSIVPCGIRDHGVTSMERVLGRRVEIAEVIPPLVRAFAETFGLEAEQAAKI